MTEWELLLTLVRPSANRAAISQLITAGVDWDRFQELSNRNELGSFAASQLIKLVPELLPTMVADGIRRHLMGNTARQMRAEHQLAELASAFRSAGLPLLSFKGPTLVQMLYGSASLREYGDLDVMVRPEDVPASRDLLVRLGYTTEFTGSNPATAPVTRFAKELAFYQQDLHPIDLHWDLSAQLMPSPLDVGEVWQRAGTVKLNGVAVATLGLEDQLVYLCYHGGKHLWCTLSQVCDIGWLVAKHPELDWNKALDLAQRNNSKRLLLVGLRMAVNLLSVDMPELVNDELSSRGDVRAAADAREKELMSRTGEAEEAKTPALFWLLESPGQKLRYALSVALVPTLAEWRAIRLPESLFWLYYPLRIVRLPWKYFALGIKWIFRRR